MQIAKMFASLGFNIDSGDLNAFEAKLSAARVEMSNFARFANRSSAAVRKLTKDMKALNGALDTKQITSAREKMSTTLKTYAKDLDKNSNVLMRFSTQANTTTLNINRLADVTMRGDYAWLQYADAVGQAYFRLTQVKAEIAGIRTAAPIANLGVGAGGSRAEAGRTPSGGGGGGHGGGGNGGAGAGRNFLKPLMPTGMGVGGALGAGYAVKELVAAGREVQRMDSAVLAVSRNTEDYENNLAFIRSDADRLGIDFVELGQSYGKTFAAAKGVMTTKQVQTMFSGITEYMTAVKLSAEDQKGALRAVAQMFSKDVVQAEEARQQFGERIPDAMKLMEKAAKNAGYEFTDFNKAMKDGMFKPAVLMKEVGKLMRERANNNDALANSLKTSAVQQQRFTNAMKAFAGALLKSGLDQILTDIFNALTGIVKTLSPLVLWLAKGISGITAFSKANTGLAKAIGLVILALIAMRSQAIVTGVSMVAMFMASVVAATLAGGAVAGLTILFKALKGAIIASGIGLLILGLVEAGNAYNNYLNGENNWIGNLLGQLKVLRSSFELLGFQAQAAWDIIKSGGGTSRDRSLLLNTTDILDADGKPKSKRSLLGSLADNAFVQALPVVGTMAQLASVSNSLSTSQTPSSIATTTSPSGQTVKVEVEHILVKDGFGRTFAGTKDSKGVVQILGEIPTQ